MTDNHPETLNKELQPYYVEEKMSFTDILLALARQIKVLIIIPTIFCSIAIIYVLFIADPVYTSTSKIMSSSGGGISKAVGIAAQFGLNFSPGQDEQQWEYTEIIKSRTLARSVLKRKYDTEEFGLQKSLIQILTYGNDQPEFGWDTLEIMAVEILLKQMIDVSENIKTSIYTINLHASEPKLAAEVNKSLIEELDAHQQEYNRGKTGDTRQFIEERIIDTEKELMSAEERLKNFMDRNRRIENSPALQLEQQRLGREVTVLTGVFTTLKQQLETTKIEEMKESDYVVVLDPPEVPLKRSKPNKKLMVILAGILGIGLGMLLVFMMEFAANRDKEEKDKMAEVKAMVLKNLSELIPGKSNK